MERLRLLDLSIAGFGVFISQELRNLSQLCFFNLQENDLYMSSLVLVSHLSSMQYFYASVGNESSPFSFNIMVISMPTWWHSLVLVNVNFLSLEEINLSMNLFFFLIVLKMGEMDLNLGCLYWKHHEVSIELWGSWLIFLWIIVGSLI